MLSKRFHLGDVLSITTGILVSPRHVDGVYDILNFMTQDDIYTHQIPRALRECQPWLLRQHPQLADIKTPTDFGRKAGVETWLATQVAIYGETLVVEPIPTDDHAQLDPIAELEHMVPGKVIVVATDDGR